MVDLNEVFYSDGMLSKINEMKPDILVSDVSLRVAFGLFSIIHYYYLSLLVMIVQFYFLFSDCMVAVRFGHI